MTDVDVTPPSPNATSHLPTFLKGHPTFATSNLLVGLCSIIINDVFDHLGCFTNLKDGVNAIAFVANRQHIPDITNSLQKKTRVTKKSNFIFFSKNCKMCFSLQLN